jgi:hypothetical protein
VFSVKTKDGVIVLQDLPENADVLVDGGKVTVQVPGDGSAAQITTVPGKHQLQVQKDGFQAFGQEVSLASGEKKLFTVHLEPLPTDGVPASPKATNSKPTPITTVQSKVPPVARRADEDTAKTEQDSQPGPVAKSDESQAGFTNLFNGKDLTGWSEFGDPEGWRAEDGVLAGVSGIGWLGTEREYGDFELQLQYRLQPGGNSGVYFRTFDDAPRGGEGLPEGFFEVQLLDDAAEEYQNLKDWQRNGALYGLAAPMTHPDAPAAQWNNLSLRAVGSRVTVTLNGQKVIDADLDTLKSMATYPIDTKRRRGRIGLEHHPNTVEFREIRIKDLSTTDPAPPQPADSSEWKRLFNGKDLGGWKRHPANRSKWEVRDGILIGSGANGHLFTDRGDYEDFHFRVEAMINEVGDGGQCFRTLFFGQGQLKGKGYEAQIDSNAARQIARTGSLMHFGVEHEIRDMRVKSNEWFTQDVIARGNRIIIMLNGEKTVEFVDPNRTYTRGHLALQVLDNSSVVKFRKVEIKEFLPVPRPDAAPTATEPKTGGERAATQPINGFKSLFNGKDFSHWTVSSENETSWTIEDGVIQGAGNRSDGPSQLVSSRMDYKDFDLKFEIRSPDEFNKHLMFRHVDKDGDVHHYRFHVGGLRANNPTSLLGDYFYDTGGQNFDNKMGLVAIIQPRMPPLTPNTWHRVRLKVIGFLFRLWVDEHEVSAFRDEESRSRQGQIVFAVLKGGRLQLRKIEINESPERTPKLSPQSSKLKPAPRSRLGSGSVLLPAGSMWKGHRSYRKGAYAGNTVTYELHVRQRQGRRFVGHIFDNGSGRNRAEVQGELNGQTITWHERQSHLTDQELVFTGTLAGDDMRLTFNGHGGNVTSQGDAELSRQR